MWQPENSIKSHMVSYCSVIKWTLLRKGKTLRCNLNYVLEKTFVNNVPDSGVNKCLRGPEVFHFYIPGVYFWGF